MTSNGLLGELAAWSGLAAPPPALAGPSSAAGAAALAISRSRLAGILDVCDRVIGESSRRGHVFDWLDTTVEAYYPGRRLVILTEEQPEPDYSMSSQLIPAHSLRLFRIRLADFAGDSGLGFSRLLGELRLLAGVTAPAPGPAPAAPEPSAIRWNAPPAPTAPDRPAAQPAPVAFAPSPAPAPSIRPAPPPTFVMAPPPPPPPPAPPPTPAPAKAPAAAPAPPAAVSAALQRYMAAAAPAPRPVAAPAPRPVAPPARRPVAPPAPPPPPTPRAAATPAPAAWQSYVAAPRPLAPPAPAPPPPSPAASGPYIQTPLPFASTAPALDPVLAHLIPAPAREVARRRVGQRQAEAAARAARFVEARSGATAARNGGHAAAHPPLALRPKPAPRPPTAPWRNEPASSPFAASFPGLIPPTAPPDTRPPSASTARAAAIERALAKGRSLSDRDPRPAAPEHSAIDADDIPLAFVVGAIVLLEFILGAVLFVAGGPVVLGFGLLLDAAARVLGTVAAARSGKEWGSGWRWICALAGSPGVVVFAFQREGGLVAADPAPLAGPVAALATLVLLVGLLGLPVGI
jgi:hypothetical protein